MVACGSVSIVAGGDTSSQYSGAWLDRPAFGGSSAAQRSCQTSSGFQHRSYPRRRNSFEYFEIVLKLSQPSRTASMLKVFHHINREATHLLNAIKEVTKERLRLNVSIRPRTFRRHVSAFHSKYQEADHIRHFRIRTCGSFTSAITC